MDKIIKNNKLLSNARRLRREMTKQERHLWYDFLRTYPAKIYKQHIIGNYIVDFYCHKSKTVIEIDGGQHYEEEAIEYDKRRTEYFNSLNINVLRFSNIDIDRNFYNVCAYIDEYIKSKVI